MSSSKSQHHPHHNQQGRTRQPAASSQSEYGPDYNSYELLSNSSFASHCRSYSESDHSKQTSETHAESSSEETVKSESPPTDSSHVSKVALRLHNHFLRVAHNNCSIPSTGNSIRRRTDYNAYGLVMLEHKSKTPRLPGRVFVILANITTSRLKAHLRWTSKPLRLDNTYLCFLKYSNHRKRCTTALRVPIGLSIMITTGRLSISCITMHGSPGREVATTSSVWDIIILGLNTDIPM